MSVRIIATLVATVFAVACAGPGGAKPSSTALTPAVQKLVTAAASEGGLSLQWTPGAQSVADEVRRNADGYKAAYGLSIPVTYTPGPPMSEMTAKILQDFQAGRPARTDVVLADEAHITALWKANALEGVLWTSWAPNIRDPKLTIPGGAAVQVQTRLPGITYSTRLTGDAAPRSLADLLRPSLRGRVATTPQGATFDYLGSPQVWGSAKTIDYVRQLSGQLSKLVECGEEDRIQTGEFDAFAYDCGGNRAAQLAKRGARIEWVIPSDGAFVGYLYLGVPKNAPHPNAAKLWINYMLGRPAQDVMYEYELADLHLLQGSKSFQEVDRYTKQGYKFFELTVEFMQSDENRGIRNLRPEIQSILQRSAAASR